MNREDIQQIIFKSIRTGVPLEGHTRKTLCTRILKKTLIASGLETAPEFGVGILTKNQHRHIFEILDQAVTSKHYYCINTTEEDDYTEVRAYMPHTTYNISAVSNLIVGIDGLFINTLSRLGKKPKALSIVLIAENLSQFIEFKLANNLSIDFSGTKEAHENLLKVIKSYS